MGKFHDDFESKLGKVICANESIFIRKKMYMDKLDVADTLGIPLAVATGGLSLGFTVANNVRLAKVVAESTRFSRSLPENYDLKANSSMRILCLKFKDDPQPLEFTVDKLGQTYSFAY